MASTAASDALAGAGSRARSGTAGMLLFPVFLGVVVLLTWARWDFLHSLGWTLLYDGRVAYPSVLARSDLGLLQTANFVLVGVLAAWFGRGLRPHFRHRWSAGVALAGLAGVTLSGALLAFPTDLPGEAISWHGAIHGVGFILLLLGCTTTALASGLALRGAPGWRGYRAYSLFTAVVAVLTVLVGIMAGRLGQVFFYVTITALLGWFAVMGARLRQLARAQVASPLEGATSPHRSMS
jgi:hypothetical protein